MWDENRPVVSERGAAELKPVTRPEQLVSARPALKELNPAAQRRTAPHEMNKPTPQTPPVDKVSPAPDQASSDVRSPSPGTPIRTPGHRPSL